MFVVSRPKEKITALKKLISEKSFYVGSETLKKVISKKLNCIWGEHVCLLALSKEMGPKNFTNPCCLYQWCQKCPRVFVVLYYYYRF